MSRNDGLAGDSSIARVTSDSVMLGAERVAQVPQRLAPDLAVGVHLGAADDLAEVAVGVAAGPRAGASPGQPGAGRADRAVDRLACGSGRRPRRRTRPSRTSPCAAVSRCEALVDQEVERVPVAPRLAHRAGLDVAERRVAVGVDDEPVGQAVGVLVVDDVGLVAAVRRRGTGPRPGTPCRARGTGTSASSAAMPSGGVSMLALSMWLPSGRPPAVLAPSIASAPARRSSPCRSSSRSKLPAASVKPIGAAQQVVVELVDEVEDLGGVLLAVGLPRERRVRVPRAGERGGAAAADRGVEGLERESQLVLDRRNLLAGLRQVVVVDVAVGVRESCRRGLGGARPTASRSGVGRRRFWVPPWGAPGKLSTRAGAARAVGLARRSRPAAGGRWQPSRRRADTCAGRATTGDGLPREPSAGGSGNHEHLAGGVPRTGAERGRSAGVAACRAQDVGGGEAGRRRAGGDQGRWARGSPDGRAADPSCSPRPAGRTRRSGCR